MATEEIEISQLELAQTVQGDMVMAVDTATDTKSLSLTQVKNWISQPLQTEIDTVDANALHKNQISNCLLEIPQDIKLELSSGTLTLKAGSKVYFPNGTFITLSGDITLNNYGANKMFIHTTRDGRLYAGYMTGGTVSERPSEPINYASYYNTTTQVCEYYNGSYWTEISLPIAIVTRGATAEVGFTSIDQVFNGFGYIGSTVFALPNVKGLIPNGRNADGTLKSIEFKNTKVATNEITGTRDNYQIRVWKDTIRWGPEKYNEKDNVNIFLGDNSIKQETIAGNFSSNNGVITSFTTKPAFHAVDYNDFEKAMLKEDWVKVSTVPASPDSSKFYYIPEN